MEIGILLQKFSKQFMLFFFHFTYKNTYIVDLKGIKLAFNSMIFLWMQTDDVFRNHQGPKTITVGTVLLKNKIRMTQNEHLIIVC